jgi:Uncharacterized conserved protein
MIKIAVASDNGMVTEHFGHCEGFIIFDTENNKIVKSETIANPGINLDSCLIFLPIVE